MGVLSVHEKRGMYLHLIEQFVNYLAHRFSDRSTKMPTSFNALCTLIQHWVNSSWLLDSMKLTSLSFPLILLKLKLS